MISPCAITCRISNRFIIRSGRNICRNAWGRNNTFFCVAARTLFSICSCSFISLCYLFFNKLSQKDNRKPCGAVSIRESSRDSRCSRSSRVQSGSPEASKPLAGRLRRFMFFPIGIGIGIGIVSPFSIPENIDRIIYGDRSKSFPMLMGNCRGFL